MFRDYSNLQWYAPALQSALFCLAAFSIHGFLQYGGYLCVIAPTPNKDFPGNEIPLWIGPGLDDWSERFSLRSTSWRKDMTRFRSKRSNRLATSALPIYTSHLASEVPPALWKTFTATISLVVLFRHLATWPKTPLPISSNTQYWHESLERISPTLNEIERRKQ